MDGDEFGPPPWLEYTRYAAEDETESRFTTGDDDTSSMGSSASSATSYSTVWTVDSAGVRSKRTKKKKKKKRGKRTVACSVCGRKESSSVPIAQSHFTAAQRKKKRGARCKSCLGAHVSRRTLEYHEFGLSLLRGAEREAAKIDELITRPSIAWSTTGQIMLIDGLSGAHASLYGARIGGVPGSSVPPLVSAWRMETGECVFERAHFLHGGRAAEAGLAIRARIEDTSRPLRAIIVTDLGTSESLDAFEEVNFGLFFYFD